MIRAAPRASCRCCGNPGTVLYEGLRDELFSAPGTWSMKRCQRPECGLLWLDPMPLDEDLGKAYECYHTHGGRSRPGVRQAGKVIYRLLVDAVLFPFGIPAERRRMDSMLLASKRPATLLDVGCGEGAFLAQMARRGWVVAGVDFDPAAAAAARATHGVDVQVGTIDEVVASGRCFDVVTASHVIEHVPDPLQFLTQCRRLLNRGGSVVLRTPNAASVGHRRYSQAWRGLEPPRHLHIFTPAALVSAARAAGFDQIECFTSSAGAEGILVASHFLRRRHSFRPQELTAMEVLESKALAPLLAVWAKLKWLADRRCGEEIYAVLRDNTPARP